MTDSRFDLPVIFRTIARKIKFIILFALLAVALGLVFGLLQKKEYVSHAVFIVKSPMTMDRNHIFRQGDYQNNDFFATENDIDQIITISQNDIVYQYVADKFDLAKHYGVKDNGKAAGILKKKTKIIRGDTRNIDLTTSDTDPRLAADMAAAIIQKIEATYRQFFLQTNTEMIAVLRENIARIDTELVKADDSINSIRNRYGLFSQLLPARGSTLAQTSSAGGSIEKADGLEILEKATSLKDQLLRDRADYFSLINEYSIGLRNDDLSLLYTVEQPWPADKPSIPNIPLILGICFVAGIGFSVILVLLKAYYQTHISASR